VERIVKILSVHSAYAKDENKRSSVDQWRCARPLEELAKHEPTWKIDHQPTFIKGIEKYKDAKEFTAEEMEKAYEIICGYDIVFSSYHADPTAYSMLKVAAKNKGVKFIMDVDDDMFAVNPDNPFWVKMDDEKCYWMQCMIRDNDYISTTTEKLAKVFRDRREHPPETVFVNPNLITDIYQHPPFDNGDKIVIGYFGGSSHYADLHTTGVPEALERLMHENKKIHFKAVGMPLDKYIPRARYHFVDGKRGNGWLKELYPSLKMDIALAPLDNNIFNNGKSNIKWIESTRAGACFVGSNFGPYDSLDKSVAELVPENTPEAWYRALKRVTEDVEYRKQMVKNAQAEVEKNWTLEKGWKQYRDMFIKVKGE
jgi:glycosyltransferase involved in cell wall biosynthesis